MTTVSDARHERAAAAFAKQFIGPPKLKALVITEDDEGRLITFTGKLCLVCQVQLTSRNRFGKKTMCIEHGKEHAREKSRLWRVAHGVPTKGEQLAALRAARAAAPPRVPAQRRTPCPDAGPVCTPSKPARPLESPIPPPEPLPPLHEEALYSFRYWLKDPTCVAQRERLDSAMRNVELNARLTHVRDAELMALLRQAIPSPY